MDGDGDGGGFNSYNDSYSGDSSRGPGYNDHCRDDLPFEPVSRNNDAFSFPEDIEEKYRNEAERIRETDIDEIKPLDEDKEDTSSTDGKMRLAAVLGGSLANSIAEGLSEKHKPRNGSATYTNFEMRDGEKYPSEETSCMQDCVYYGVLCCQCSIL